jgi:hypothetical protein
MSAVMLLHMRVVANTMMMIIVTSISAHDALMATLESFVCGIGEGRHRCW